MGYKTSIITVLSRKLWGKVPLSPARALIQALVAERSVSLPACDLRGSAVMVTDKECEHYARECVRLAELTKDPQLRDQLLNMAREWMALAMHENEMPKPETPVQ